MADSTSQKMVTRGIPAKALNFDGPFFSLQITQAKLNAVSAANTVAGRRIKIRNDTSKEAQVEKSSKESTFPDAEKRKKFMDDASGVKGKEVDAGTSSDTRDEKEIKLIVKHPPILSPHISSYTNTDIVSDLKEKLTPEQYKIFGTTYFGSFLDMKRYEVQHQLFRCFMVLQLSTFGLVPQTIFDANLFRQRYGALLWYYYMRKIDADAISENEAPSKIVRQITYSDTSVKIVLE